VTRRTPLGGAPVTRRSTRLGDGRELIYFDDRPGRPRPAADHRRIAPVQSASEIRLDPIHDEAVIIAAHRQQRTHLPPADRCPLCPSRGGHATEIPEEDYDVVVFENRFPAMSGTARRDLGELPGHTEQRPGHGRCEVICFSADHDTSFWRLPSSRLRTIGQAWVDRTVELSELPGVEYVLCFENRGVETGVTLHHPHGQIYAYPFVPPRVQRALDSARRHRESTDRCLFCDTVAAEVRDGRRVVATTEGFVAFVPAAARWPFEVHVYPRAHVEDLPALGAAAREEMVALQADVLERFDGLFSLRMPYVSAWMQAPVRRDRALAHLRLEVFSVRRAPGKLKYLAGSETAAGVFLNDVLPEDAARMLREARPAHR
jgi:UDPglucose--hexose-1-phosphate uridylyltransferase